MTATNHGLSGALIAISLQKYPVLAMVLSPFSHFILDAIPHYSDPKMSIKSRAFYKILTTDAILAVVTTLAVASFWPEIALLVIACAFLAASPDLMWLYFEYIRPTPRKNLPWYAKFHSWIQWSQTKPGILVELMWFMVLFPALILMSK